MALKSQLFRSNAVLLIMQPRFYILLAFMCMVISCKSSKDNTVSQVPVDDRPITANLNKKFKGEIKTKESITKSACRIEGVIVGSQQQDTESLLMTVTSFLGEGASFNTYRPAAGDSIKVSGLGKRNLNYGDTLKIEVQTLPEIRSKAIQQVTLIKILDL